MERRRKTVTEIVKPRVMDTERGQLALAQARIRKLEARVANLEDFGLKLADRVLKLELHVSVLRDQPLAETIGV